MRPTKPFVACASARSGITGRCKIELLAIIEEAARSQGPRTPAEVLAEIRRIGVATPREAAALVRADRDAR